MKTKYYFYATYILWVIVAIVLKICGASWWVGTSWLWLPPLCFVSLISIFHAVSAIGAVKIAKAEAKIPNDCEHCLFGKTAKTLGEPCIGIDSGAKTDDDPTKICRFYRKSTRL